MANLIAYLVVLSSPVALAYSWYFYWVRMRKDPDSWRNRITLISLVLVSVVAILWLPTMFLTPGADWRTGVGVAHQMAWMGRRLRAALCTLLVASLLSVAGRPRLIAPMILACLGTAALWVCSTFE